MKRKKRMAIKVDITGREIFVYIILILYVYSNICFIHSFIRGTLKYYYMYTRDFHYVLLVPGGHEWEGLHYVLLVPGGHE